MRDFFVNLFRDDTFGPIIELFNIWHILCLIILIGVTVFLSLHFKDKDEKIKKKILDIYAIAIIGLYFGDFFVHPLMENENILIVDKLPFHLCTSVGILIAITRIFKSKVKRWYHVPAVLGLIGGIMYMTVPTGVDGDYFFCYRTLQTLLFHSMVVTYGVLSIVYKDVTLEYKNLLAVFIVIVIQTIISLFANNIYSIKGDHEYNWYFSVSDPLGIGIPSTAEPFIIVAVFMFMAFLIYSICYLVRYIDNKKQR